MRWDIFDKGSVKRLDEILLQDAAIVENASPNWLPETMENELSVMEDKFMSFWRNTRRRHIEEKGWQINSQALVPHQGFKTHTIPSPGRRENPEIRWVLDTVPLNPPTREAKQFEGSADATETAARGNDAA